LAPLKQNNWNCALKLQNNFTIYQAPAGRMCMYIGFRTRLKKFLYMNSMYVMWHGFDELTHFAGYKKLFRIV